MNAYSESLVLIFARLCTKTSSVVPMLCFAWTRRLWTSFSLAITPGSHQSLILWWILNYRSGACPEHSIEASRIGLERPSTKLLVLPVSPLQPEVVEVKIVESKFLGNGEILGGLPPGPRILPGFRKKPLFLFRTILLIVLYLDYIGTTQNHGA